MRRAGSAGLVAGVVIGVLGLVFPTLAFALGPLSIVLFALRPPRAAGLGSFLAAFGVTWIVLLLRAQIDCAIADALPARECISPPLDRWYLIALAALGVGVALLSRAVRTAGSRSTPQSRWRGR